MPRPRPTYANVVATLALVVALGGTSYAAAQLPRNSVGSKQLKAQAVTPAKLSPATRTLALRGPVSPAVVSGGMTGLPSVIVGGNTQLRRGGLYGLAQATGTAEPATLSPAVPVRARHLSVALFNDLPPGGSVLIEVVAETTVADNSTPGVIACTVVGTAGADDTTCTSSGSGVVPPSSAVFVRATLSAPTEGTTNPAQVRYGFTLEPVG